MITPTELTALREAYLRGELWLGTAEWARQGKI